MNSITSGQRSYIEDLLVKRDLTGTKYEGWVPNWAVATKQQASSVIEYLLTLPKAKAAAPAPAAELEPGVYVYAGDQYARVYYGQRSGRMLAKRIHMEQDGDDWTVSYEYLGTAAKALPASTNPQRLTLDEVAGMGVTTRHCLICSRRLDDPESVDRGIGPVCASKYDAPLAEQPELNQFGNPMHEDPCVCGPYDRCHGVRAQDAADSGNWRDQFRAYND